MAESRESEPLSFLSAGLFAVAFARWVQLHPAIFAWSVRAVVAAVVLSLGIAAWRRFAKASEENKIVGQDETSVYLGRDPNRQPIFLKQRFRISHAQVIGTTNAGKSESIVLPWAISDIETGAGLLVIDGKADSAFLNKLHAYVVKFGRQDSFRLFSLAHLPPSSTFNPLAGGSAQEVAERVFSSFTFENEYYRNVQYKVFLALMRLTIHRKRVPTFRLLHRLLSDMPLLTLWLQGCEDADLKRELTAFSKLADRERLERISGLEAHLGHFASGDLSVLFDDEKPSIQFESVLSEAQICYFQLPTMYYPFLAEATGKLVLQCFQNAVAKRHLGIDGRKSFFSCYLDDFQDYIYPGFGALLNKSRSADVSVVFSHQALGDLDKVSPAFRNVVLTNTNVKVVMRNNDPDTCEYFARSFGTRGSEKTTERKRADLFGSSRTGDGSVREVEEYIHHPNEIRQLGLGEGIVAIPHPRGVKTSRVKFEKRPDLPAIALPEIIKEPTRDHAPPSNKQKPQHKEVI